MVLRGEEPPGPQITFYKIHRCPSSRWTPCVLLVSTKQKRVSSDGLLSTIAVDDPLFHFQPDGDCVPAGGVG